MKAVVIYQHGDTGVLTYEDTTIGPPGPYEVRVRNKAIGLNFTDIYFRTGAYKPPQLPFIPGNEGAGEVVAVGQEVTTFKPGDRVTYVTVLGSYADERLVPADALVKLPDEIAYETAAAMMLKGLTAHYLLHKTFAVKAGHTILIHAAAGAVGIITVQWAKRLGATVIGTVGSANKAALAKEYGCDYVINYCEEDFAARVQEITGGKGCDVVYDSIGKATYAGSLECLRPRGLFVSYGTASGPIVDFDFSLLAKHSLFATSPVLFDYFDSHEDMLAMTNALFTVVANGDVKIPIHATFPLRDAAKAQDLLEGRKTTGATILIP